MKGGFSQFPVRWVIVLLLFIAAITLVIIGALADRGVIGEGSDCDGGKGFRRSEGGFEGGFEGGEGGEGGEGFGCERSQLGRILMGVAAALFFSASIVSCSICFSARRK